MKIVNFKQIKQYKSFQNYFWDVFCKYHFTDKANNVDTLRESVLGKFCLFFGENGSGKSSVCSILKDLAQIQCFENIQPELVEIEIENGNKQIYKYENNQWTPNPLNNTSFLFFDVDFINSNVHTHGDRSNQQNKHSQNSGKIIIDLDSKANQLKLIIKEKKEEIENFEKANLNVLNKTFTDEDKNYFIAYKDKNVQEINNEISQKQEDTKKIEADLLALQKINKKYSEIKQLSLISPVSYIFSISKKEIYSELFSRQIKEKAQDKADEKIKTHFEKYKGFIESTKDKIPLDYKNADCPLCMQPLANASEFIEYYRTAFDKTYENEKNKFLTEILNRKNELDILKSSIISLPTKVLGIFNSLEKIKIDFEIEDIYKLEEKSEYTKEFEKTTIVEIDKLILSLDSLKNIEHKETEFSIIYDKLVEEVKEVERKLGNIKTLVDSKNALITSFKNKYSDQSKISNEIQEKTKKLSKIKDTILFLNSGKIEIIKTQNESILKQKTLTEKLKEAQDDLNKHLATTIPESVITKMIAILSKFNLNFTLEHIKPASNTKDYTFSFIVKDQKGCTRNFKDGLSEGERQLISIAFFFAINENLPNKNNTILIFDDPITSLDSPNLKILADLVYSKTQEFSQVIIFTHHPLFYKYLAKNPNPCKFGILKNNEAFGGSFIFSDSNFDLTEEVQKCNEEIKQNAKNGVLQPHGIALKYGQLLRLAVEKFVKNDLLMWNKESNFENEIVANLSSSKNKIQRLNDDDLEVITNIYKYCNHSNLLHIDKENPSALSELMAYIDKFVNIQNKAISAQAVAMAILNPPIITTHGSQQEK